MYYCGCMSGFQGRKTFVMLATSEIGYLHKRREVVSNRQTGITRQGPGETKKTEWAGNATLRELDQVAHNYNKSEQLGRP